MADQVLTPGIVDDADSSSSKGAVLVSDDETAEQMELVLRHSQVVLRLTSCDDDNDDGGARRNSLDYQKKVDGIIGEKRAMQRRSSSFLKKKLAAADASLDSLKDDKGSRKKSFVTNTIDDNDDDDNNDDDNDDNDNKIETGKQAQEIAETSFRRASGRPQRHPSQVRPGAVHISSGNPPQQRPSQINATDEELVHMRTTLESTVTAVVLEPGVLEEEIRQEILKETVEATSVQPEQELKANVEMPTTPPSFWKRYRVKISIFIVILLVLIAIAIALTVTMVDKGHDDGEDESMPDQDEISYLQNLVVDQSTLEDPNSPQSRALQWMLRDVKVEDGDINYARERFTLAILYYSLGGENWTRNDGWITDTPECSWYLGTLPLQPSTCSMYSKGGVYKGITYLFLNGNNLVGSIPPEILNFGSVRFLDLRDNQITGPLPLTLFSIGLLELKLDGNHLTGPIPDPITSTKSAAIASPHSVTARVKSGEWKNDANQPGKGGDQGGTDGIEILSLSRNHFTGTIPTWFGDLTTLAVLDLHNNSFTGTLPTELANLDKLQIARFDDNHLQGTIPSSYGDWTALNRSYFDHNQFTGDMSLSICDLHPFRLSADCDQVNCTCCSFCCYQSGKCTWTNTTRHHPVFDDRNTLPLPSDSAEIQ